MPDFLEALARYEFLRNALAAGLLAAVGCGVMGTFVVVRRIGYLAGGIAHAVLGGMGIAYFLGAAPFGGAVVAALAAALLIGWASLRRGAQEDVLISAIWAAGMSIGIVFMSKTPGFNADLRGYLFGNILLVDRGALALMLVLDLLVLACVGALFKQFLAVSFDEEFARLRGLNTNFYYLLLLCMVSLTVVLLIPVVGVVLVLALLTLPAAIAAHLSGSIGMIMLIATLLGAVFTSAGLAIAYTPDLPPGATIVLVASGSYVLVLLLAGRLARWRAGAGLPALLLPALLVPCMLPARASGPPAAPLDLREVAAGVYVHHGQHAGLDSPRRGDSANIGFIVGERCVAVVDTGGSLATGKRLLAALRSVTAKPVCYVINTHVHFDHVLGNAALAATDARFAGHRELAPAIEANRRFFAEAFPEELAGAEVIAPSIAVDGQRELDLGGRRLQLEAWPTAHTSQDLTVLDERTGTLWLGDLVFRERVPALDGSLEGWIAALEALRARELAVAVPGHGETSTDWPAMSDAVYRYLTTLRDEVRAAVAEGMFLEEAIDSVGTGMREDWLLFDEAHGRNVSRAFTELEWE